MFPRAAEQYRCVPDFNLAARSYNDQLRERAVGLDSVHVCHHQGMVDNSFKMEAVGPILRWRPL